MEYVAQETPRVDFQLELKFNTGETRLFDVRSYLQKGVCKNGYKIRYCLIKFTQYLV